MMISYSDHDDDHYDIDEGCHVPLLRISSGEVAQSEAYASEEGPCGPRRPVTGVLL